MKVRPLHDRIIVQRIDEGEQKDRRNHHPRHRQGKAAAGQGHRRRPRQAREAERVPLDVKEGETILFGECSGQDIKIDGEEYLIMREDEVLAVLDSK